MTQSEPQRLHPLTPFFDLILFGRQLLVPLVFAVVAGGGGRERSEALFVIPVLLGTLYGVARWWRFTYTFDGARFVVDEGVLTRKRRVIPLDRVQQVEMHSKLRHRLLGVTVLRVDTAGGGGDAEVDLSVVSVAEAARLRSMLLPAVASSASPPALSTDEALRDRSEPTGEVLVRLSPWQLAIAGMTGSELALMLTVVGWFVQVVDDLSVDVLANLDGRLSAPSSAAGFGGAALTVLVVWLALAAGAGVVKHFGFEMRRSGADLRVRRGLFERREGSMPLRRVQAVVVAQSIVRRALGFAAIAVQSGGGSAGTSGGVRRIDVPLLPGRDVEGLVRALLPMPAAWSMTALRPHPRAAHRRAILRRVVLAAVGVVVPALLLGGPAGVALGALALVVAAFAGELAYLGLGHASVAGILTARSGGVARQTAIVPAAKVQSTRLRSSPFQRRAGLATLSIDVAGKGRTPTIRDAAATHLRGLQVAIATSPPARADEHEIRERPAPGAPATSRHA